MALQLIEETSTGLEWMAKINANFSELYENNKTSDEVETFTNKTIDAGNNTIENLTVASFADTAKTGDDNAFVTGVPGISGNLAKWSEDNLVDSGYIVDEDGTLGGLTPSDVRIPTQAAVKEAINNASHNYVESLPVMAVSGATVVAVGTWQTWRMTSGNSVTWGWKMPSWATEVVSAKMMIIPDATETITWNIYTNKAVNGELYTLNAASDTSNSLAVTINVVTEIDLVEHFNSVNPDDYFTITFYSNLAYIFTTGFLVIEYR